MPWSGYLRALGLSTPIRSVVDHIAGADLAKVTGTGPLKLRPLEKRSQGANAIDVELVMVEFGELQVGINAATNEMV